MQVPYKLSVKFCYSDDQGLVYQNYKFHDTEGRGSYVGAWPYKSNNENALFI